jgi:hypothetical protein
MGYVWVCTLKGKRHTVTETVQWRLRYKYVYTRTSYNKQLRLIEVEYLGTRVDKNTRKTGKYFACGFCEIFDKWKFSLMEEF